MLCNMLVKVRMGSLYTFLRSKYSTLLVLAQVVVHEASSIPVCQVNKQVRRHPEFRGMGTDAPSFSVMSIFAP